MEEKTAHIKLPKDAEGQEIPLDTGTLYEANGVAKYIYYYKFDPRGAHWLAETDDGARTTSELLLNQPDSWEKLEEDLKTVEDYGKSSSLDNPVCHYTNMVGKSCSRCKFYGGTSCTGKMCADIADRIRKLRARTDE